LKLLLRNKLASENNRLTAAEMRFFEEYAGNKNRKKLTDNTRQYRHILNKNEKRIPKKKDDCLLGCCAVYSGRRLPTFQRCLLPPSSGRSSKHL
jgi:hypothetical protein